MEIYTRTAQYHETDQMGVIHHSNYLKWFEEARTHWLNEHGISYRRMESDGIYSPVVEMHVFYKKPVKYTETVEIEITIIDYTGVKFEVAYTVREVSTKEIRCTGQSKHCFISRDGKILSVKKLNHFSDLIMQTAFGNKSAE